MQDAVLGFKDLADHGCDVRVEVGEGADSRTFVKFVTCQKPLSYSYLDSLGRDWGI